VQVVDPGLGFAKTGDHNLTLLREGARFREALGQLPVLVGASRKRFLGELTGRSVPRERVLGLPLLFLLLSYCPVFYLSISLSC
jgi:dihydropteroate synthase